MAAPLPLAQELRPSLVRFADENDVGEPCQRFRLDRRHRSANNHHDPARLGLLENFDQPPPLDAHAGQANEVGAAQPLEIDVFDVFIDQRHLMMVGYKSSQQGEAGDRQVGAFP